MSKDIDTITSSIWREEPEPDNPFAARVCYLSGYDVYGDLLGKASWADYLHLLFTGEPPNREQALLLHDLAVALANPGPRDHSVRAAMNGGVAGSTSAACLIAALAVGAGNLGGAHEVSTAMECWKACGQDLAAWQVWLQHPPGDEKLDIWRPLEHPPGFDPHGTTCATAVRQTLEHLAANPAALALPWLQSYREHLERAANCPLAMSGVAAAALCDLGFSAEQGEMLYLLMRLPGAAAHAIEQRRLGWRRYPFWAGKVHLADQDSAPPGAGEPP